MHAESEDRSAGYDGA